MGDLDGDGVVDLLVGSPLFFDFCGNHGSLAFVSGRDGTVLSTIVQDRVENGSDVYGTDVSAIGDVDGDGFQDAAFCVVDWDFFFGRAYLVSGRTRTVVSRVAGLRSFVAPHFQRLGDVDGDGRDEWVVANSADPRSIEVRAGFEGTVLFTLPPASQPGWRWDSRGGSDVAVVGDIDGDGIADVAASGPTLEPPSAWVSLFSGRDGSLLRRMSGGDSLERDWGGGVELFDHELLYVTHPPSSNMWALHALSLDGRGGRFIAAGDGYLESQGGYESNAVDDCDGDGTSDLLLVVHEYDSTSLLLLSGASGRRLEGTFELPTLDPAFSSSVDSVYPRVGDLDGDGRNDIVLQLRAGPEQSPCESFAICALSLVPAKR